MNVGFTFLFIIFFSFLQAKDYDASLFGIQSNGQTLNTTSIQAAIDFIHDNGGGRLVFSVGRYVTGSIYLKSNVTLHLKEGAILVGSTNPYDYEYAENWTAMIFAIDQDSIGITGNGIIDGRGYEVATNLVNLIHKGVVIDPRFSNDRPYARIRPQNIYMKRCRYIQIKGVSINNPASWNQQYDLCSHLLIDKISVNSKNYWNNDGLDIVNCDSVVISNSYFDASDDAICLKSHNRTIPCKDILIYNNRIRSSASAIKFGTYSHCGYKNITILKNTVFDTYRSAITFSMLDVGVIENILVDSLEALNTGNALFIRIGERRKGQIGSMKNIHIRNVTVNVPAEKADRGYMYEGPIEDQPRNISPAVIVGHPEQPIENLTLENIEINYPGDANPNYANVPLESLDSIPELLAKYPEYSMFKELPAWGFYVRHAQQIHFKNVRLN